ncbi:MAG: oxidoreductase [Bacteroidota bacterium]
MELTKSKKTAILVGSTGLVGSELLTQLIAHPAYDKIVTLTRRKSYQTSEKVQNVVVNFDDLARSKHHFKGDDLFICLGTTRAKAGSAAAFRRVDYDYVVQSAQLAKEQGCKQCILVSSVGADQDSRLLYPRTKGEAEEAIKALDFWATHILQPSLLLGDRSEFRLGEHLGKVVFGWVDKVAGNRLGSYRPVEAEVVAKAMLAFAQRLQAGEFTHPSDEIIRVGVA